MRVKILVPESEDFNAIVGELRKVGPVYMMSRKRRFIAAEELPEWVSAKYKRRGVKIEKDEQYEIGVL